MASSPKISVLVPTYNYARFLPEAIGSVLAQDFADFELIISDDASTDGSAAIIRPYAERDPRIRFHRQEPNLGMVANWNWCLRQARGEYVQFVFGDDLLVSPRALTTLATLLDAHPEAAIASSARLVFDAESKVTDHWNDLPRGRHDGPALIARCLRTRRNQVGEPSVVMFRRQAAGRGFDPSFRQLVDLEMWFHLLAQNGLVHTDEPLCGFRRHAAQQTAVNQQARVSDLEMIELIDRYLACPALQPLLPPGGFGHRLVLFRHQHYLRKWAAKHPETSRALGRMQQQLPLGWFLLCWGWHRLTKPAENLRRKIAAWSFRLRQSGRRPRPASVPTAGATSASFGETFDHWVEELALGLQHKSARWLASGMLTFGAGGAILLLTGGPLPTEPLEPTMLVRPGPPAERSWENPAFPGEFGPPPLGPRPGGHRGPPGYFPPPDGFDPRRRTMDGPPGVERYI